MDSPRLPFVRACLSALVAFLGFASALAADPPAILVGAATEVINPPAAVGLAGYYHARKSDGVLDDLQAKAMVLDDGSTEVAIVICDLIEMPRWIVEAARNAIHDRTRIPATNILIAATHTHTAPVLAHEPAASEGDPEGAIRVRYGNDLAQRMAGAVSRAHDQRQPARLLAGVGHEDKLGGNRRWWLRDGSVGWNPGKRNPALVRPAGPIDPEIGILHAQRAGQPAPTPLVTFINYAMHPDTTGGTRMSADYPGALSRELALYLGPGAPTLFANGTCGNINHVQWHWGESQTSPAEANRLGVILAGAVFRSWPDLRTVDAPGSLRVSVESVELDAAPYTAAELEQARADVQVATDSTREGFMKLVRAQRILEIAGRANRPYSVEVQVITLGDQFAWVSWPGEIFVELGLSVKAASPFRHTYNVELANGTIGYIPNKPAWQEGNYEVESSRVTAGSGERLVASALRQLETLHLSALGRPQTGAAERR